MVEQDLYCPSEAILASYASNKLRQEKSGSSSSLGWNYNSDMHCLSKDNALSFNKFLYFFFYFSAAPPVQPFYF